MMSRDINIIQLFSEVIMMSHYQNLWDKWLKILHSSNFLAPNYNSR